MTDTKCITQVPIIIKSYINTNTRLSMHHSFNIDTFFYNKYWHWYVKIFYETMLKYIAVDPSPEVLVE